MSRPLECPRCHIPTTGTSRRRGRCTACGASLASADDKVSDIRELLHSRLAPGPLVSRTDREQSAAR